MTDLGGLEVVLPEVARILRAKSGAERLRLAHEAWELVGQRLGVFLATRHPDWGPERVGREVARRFLHDSG